jgi:ABC-type multidrug transport system fused ATPase/permease subunit
MPTDLWAYLRPERPALACGGAALLVSTFSNAFAPRAMGRVVDAYAARRRDGGAALRRELAATGLVFACGALASGVRTACFAGACQGALRRLRADAYRACLVRRRGAHDAAAAADAVDADARTAARFLTESLQNGLRYASSVVNGGARLVLLSPNLFLELLVALPVGAGLVRAASRGVSRRGDAAERAERDAVALARDRLRPEAFDVVRCAGAEAVEHRRFAGLLAGAEAAGRTHGVARGCLMGSLDAVGKLTVLGVVFRGGARVERGDMTGGDLLAFALYAAYAALGLAGLARVALGDRKAFRRAERRLLDALDAAGADGAATAAEAAVPDAPDGGAAAVALDGVDVAYAGRGDFALRGVSLRAAAGRVTGVVGASGAGKSTLLRCCAGLVAPAAGAVRVCGVDVNGGDAARVAAVRRTLASHVQQGAPLLAHGPRLLDAVAYLGLGAPVDVERARGAVAACADPVSESVGGLEGDVGRDAGDLSGGQKNRVALARALYRAGARVLLLDEPTAALDGPGEAAALDGALGAARRRGCAVLLVAHSRAAISRCDDVVVLERGRLVERGAYGALAADPSSRLNALLE